MGVDGVMGNAEGARASPAARQTRRESERHRRSAIPPTLPILPNLPIRPPVHQSILPPLQGEDGWCRRRLPAAMLPDNIIVLLPFPPIVLHL